MGTPSKSAFFAELTRAGVPIVDMTHGSRDLGSFTAQAVTVHDSVTGGMSDQGAANFCKEGRVDVRGPLYGALLGKDGRLYVLTLGRSNNTGSCNSGRSQAARGGVMPLAAELGAPGSDDYSSANSTHYGIAYVTYGAGPYTSVQRERMPKVLAAYVRAAGWSPEGGARSLIGHGEVTRRKSDPALDMGELRRQVAVAAAPPVPETPDPPTTGDDDEMQDADWIKMRSMLQQECADGAARALQAYLAGQPNQQFTAEEVAAIKGLDPRGGMLGDLFNEGTPA